MDRPIQGTPNSKQADGSGDKNFSPDHAGTSSNIRTTLGQCHDHDSYGVTDVKVGKLTPKALTAEHSDHPIVATSRQQFNSSHEVRCTAASNALPQVHHITMNYMGVYVLVPYIVLFSRAPGILGAPSTRYTAELLN